MALETWGMIFAGLATLLAGLILVRPRFAAASGPGKLLVLGPVFEAVALATFAAEHFLAARDLMGIVPRWLPSPLFWTYLVGAALFAAALSFIAWRHVRWSASLLALLFLIIVVTIDLPVLPRHLHQRLFWTVTVREVCFAAGAMVLAASVWTQPSTWARTFATLGRSLVAAIFAFYAVEHFLFPHFVPGVPEAARIPAWFPAPVLLSWFIGATLLAAAIGLLVPGLHRLAAAGSGAVLLLLTLFFYVPILLTKLHTPLVIEGINYVADTLLFASTALLAGLAPGSRAAKPWLPEKLSSPSPVESSRTHTF